MRRPTTSAKQVTAAERRTFVISLRKAGHRYQDIVDRTIEKFGLDVLPKGWDTRYAYKDVKRELDKLNKERTLALEEIRTLEVQRIDELLTVIWPMAMGGNLGAVDRIIRLMERRARYEGLDRPAVLDVTSGGEKIELLPGQRDRAVAMFAEIIRTEVLGEPDSREGLVGPPEHAAIPSTVESG